MTELTPEEKEYLTVLNDPVAWCEATLRDPEDPTKPLRFRPHQKKILSSQPYLTTNKYGERVYRRRLKVLRLARRSGKTVVMAAEAIYKAATNANFRILYVAPFECLTKSANVLMKDGSYRTIEELLTSWKGREVQSLDENMKLTNSSIVDMHWSGFRDVYRLQLDGGYEITSTDNHRYLTIDGWKELKDLKVGDFVAVPRRTTGEPIEGLDKNIARMFNRDMYVGKIEDSDIYWKRIIDITHTGKEDTYDLEIDQTHTFIANNIIVHNSQSSIFFDMIDKMIGNTLIHPVSFRKKPYYIEFSNGSYIKGATANVRSSNKGDSIRGAEGDHICLAEGTRVMNDLGEYVPIETLANNVRIMGFDEDGPSIGNLISISHRKANCISIETPISEIVCTPDHPLFDGEKDVPACDAFEVVCDLGFLNSDRIGQVCRKLSKHYHHEITREDLKELWVGGTFYLLPILRRENVKGKKRVYTLRVSQDARHRYIANGCVVHNCLDEMDYGMDDVIEDVILPIFNGNNIATITGASTPTGERGIFYKWCFPKEMLISMPGGGRMIKDIRVGDQVIAADGSVDVVTKLFEQPYDGELYNFNISSLRIRCTPNHEFMTMDRGFVPASDLKLNDYVEIPKYMLDRNPEFPLKRFDSDYYRHPQTRIKHRTWNELVRKFTNQHNQLRFARMVCIYARWGRNIPERQVKSNADKGVQFFCRKNSPLGDELKASMEFFFGVTPELTEYQEHVQHVYRSVNAVKVFGALAPGKPTVIRLDPWILQEKFKSAIYEIYRDNSATKSPAMAMQLLTYSLNFPGDRMIVPVVGYRWCTPYWHIHHRLPFKFKDGKWYGIIKKIRVHQFNRPVYNFETEKTHTYTAGGVGVHNCTDKTQGVEEFHYDCWSNPKYTKESDNQIKKMVSATRYLREQLAEFGESLEGVFRHADMLQIIASYKYEDLVYNPKNMYIMGVDWNEKFGVSIVIVERSKNTGKYRIFRHIIIDKQELTQTVAVNKIIDIHTREFWCHAIYVDLGYGCCVGPDTLLNTPTGTKRIADICIGDKVLTFDGSYRNVKDKIVREDEKESYLIKPTSCVPTIISDCHPFLTYRTSDIERFHEIVDESKLEWRKCPEIDKKKDLVAISKTDDIIDYDNGRSYIVDLYELLSPKLPLLKCNDNEIWLPSSYIVKDRKYNKNKDDFTEPELLKFPRYFDVMSLDFQRVYGWYLSKGNCNTSAFEIAQKVGHKTEEIEELTGSLNRLFGKQVSIYKKTMNAEFVYQIVVSGKILSVLMEVLGGKHCQNKFIHPIFMKRAKNIGLLVQCIFHGDGHRGKHGYEISVTSSSLIYQIRQILIDNSILGNVYHVAKRLPNDQLQYRLDVLGNDCFLKKFSDFTGLKLIQNGKRQTYRCIETEHYFLVGIRVFKKIGKVKGLVDISVEDTESFCGNGIVLHNTQSQLLRQYGYEHPETKLHEIVKPIDYASKVEMLDPVSQKKVERPAKPAMVENAQLVVEAHDIQIPDCEDADYGIFGQMRCFKVNRMGMNGHPIYEGTFRGEDNDHSLNAMFLALLGFTLELQASEPVAVATYVKKIVAGSISVPQRESAIAASQGGALRDLLRRNAPNYRPAKQEKVFPVVMPRQIRIAKPFRRKTF